MTKTRDQQASDNAAPNAADDEAADDEAGEAPPADAPPDEGDEGDEGGEGDERSDGSPEDKGHETAASPKKKRVPPDDEGDEEGEGDETSNGSPDVDAAASLKKSATKSKATRHSPRKSKSKSQDDGHYTPRGQRGLTDDEGHGGSDAGSDTSTGIILPYARSFTFFQRFAISEGKKTRNNVKFPQPKDVNVRNRDLISDKEPFDWLVSMKSQLPSRIADYSKGPGHDAATGRIGCLSSTLSQTSFISTRQCEDRDRCDGDFKLWGLKKTQDIKWLKQAINDLAKKILAMSRRPGTRATAADAKSGNDIFIGSSDIPFFKCVSLDDDDIELIDFATDMRENARLWHSSKLIKDGMMWRSIMSVLVNESGSSGEAMQFLTDHESDVEFLGVVSIYTKPNLERSIAAFNIHSMMLIRYDKKDLFTEIGCVITSRDLLSSSMQERLMQICQMLQSRRHGRSEVKFNIPLSDRRIDIETKASFLSAGFNFPILEDRISSGTAIFNMPKYTFGQAWTKYYDVIRLDDDSRPSYGNASFMDAVLNDIFEDLLDYECNFAPLSGLKFQQSLFLKLAEICDWTANTELSDELVKEVASNVITHAYRSTFFPLSIIVHAVAARLKSGHKSCGIMEVPSELLQYINIAIEAPKTTSTVFRGDRHRCRLHCRMCGGYLTDESFRLYDLMSNAAISIASHFDVFPHLNGDPSNDDLEDLIWTCPPLFSSVEELRNAISRNKNVESDGKSTAPVESHRCRYGQSVTGDRKYDTLWSDEQRDSNNNKLMRLTEAVLIDANPGHNESTETNRRFLTKSLLSCLFERMFHVSNYLGNKDATEGYESDPEVGSETVSNFKGYFGRKLPDSESALRDVADDASFNPAGVADDTRLAASLRIFAGLAANIDHVFCLNLSVLSDKVAAKNFHPDLGAKLKEFFDISDETRVFDTSAGLMELKVSDVKVDVNLCTILHERPTAEIPTAEVKVPLSVMGNGWNCAEAETWFDNNPAEKKARSSSAQDSSENLLLMRSITHIKYCRTPSGERKYVFKCDFTAAINRDPGVPIKHKRLLSQKEFDCSADLIKSLPFNVVKGWRQNRWNDLSSYMKPLRKHIAQTENRSIQSIQTWRKDGWGKLLFRVEQDVKDNGAVESEVVYVRGDFMKRDFGHEKWIYNSLSHLSTVRSGRVVSVGEGATEPSRLASSTNANLPPDMWHQPCEETSDVGTSMNNVWWNGDNELKQCVQGCITNLLQHLGVGAEAMRFKQLSTLDDVSLMKELNIHRFPKNVVIDGRTDEFEKCKWLLCAHFKCNHTRQLNVTQFRSLSSMVDNLSQFKFPVIVSMKITNARYNHVIIVWKKTIIDFEQPSTYPLTANNLDFSCGPESQFLTVDRGYGILPSREMRKMCNITDWGESDVDGELKNLFVGGKRKKKRKRGKK